MKLLRFNIQIKNMKRLIYFLFIFLLPALSFAQTELQIHPAQVGSFGASAGDIPTVNSPATGGHTHITRTALATALAPLSTVGGDISGTVSNAQVVANAIGTAEIANGAVTLVKISTSGATSGQVLKFNGTSLVFDTDAGTTYTAGTGINVAGTVISNTGDLSATNELQSVTRDAATTNTATLSISGGSITVEDLFVEATATFTAGNTTATMSGTLPTDNAKLWVYRNGIRQVVGASGCSGCNVTRTTGTLTFARAISAGESVTFKYPLQ
jgi:hypothetical protein